MNTQIEYNNVLEKSSLSWLLSARYLAQGVKGDKFEFLAKKGLGGVPKGDTI